MNNIAKNDKNMARLFFAINLSQPIKDALEIIQKNNHFQGKPINPHNFHITLKFLGNVAEKNIDDLIEGIAVPQTKPFSVTLTKLAYYPKAQIGCLEPSHIPSQLLDLRKQLIKNIATTNIHVKRDKQNYRPHVSLFRQCQPLSDLSDQCSICVNIESFSLMQSLFNSKGVYYQAIAEWPIYQASLKERMLGNR